MLKTIWFIALAVVIAIASYHLTTLSQIPLFSYGVSFIGYFTASVLLSVAILGSD
jgi:hypothetical protein